MVDNYNFLNGYAVFDEVSEEFMAPFPAKNDKDAIRVFVDSLKKQQYQHFEDYTLYYVYTIVFDKNKVKDSKSVCKKIGSIEYDKEKNDYFFIQENKGVLN